MRRLYVALHTPDWRRHEAKAEWTHESALVTATRERPGGTPGSTEKDGEQRGGGGALRCRRKPSGRTRVHWLLRPGSDPGVLPGRRRKTGNKEGEGALCGAGESRVDARECTGYYISPYWRYAVRKFRLATNRQYDQ